MPSSQPSLTASWRYLAMRSYEVPRGLLHPLVPAGTELDDFDGITLASMVGFRFLPMRHDLATDGIADGSPGPAVYGWSLGGRWHQLEVHVARDSPVRIPGGRVSRGGSVRAVLDTWAGRRTRQLSCERLMLVIDAATALCRRRVPALSRHAT